MLTTPPLTGPAPVTAAQQPACPSWCDSGLCKVVEGDTYHRRLIGPAGVEICSASNQGGEREPARVYVPVLGQLGGGDVTADEAMALVTELQAAVGILQRAIGTNYSDELRAIGAAYEVGT